MWQERCEVRQWSAVWPIRSRLVACTRFDNRANNETRSGVHTAAAGLLITTPANSVRSYLIPLHKVHSSFRPFFELVHSNYNNVQIVAAVSSMRSAQLNSSMTMATATAMAPRKESLEAFLASHADTADGPNASFIMPLLRQRDELSKGGSSMYWSARKLRK